GFFSKDEILLEAYHSVPWLFWLGVVTVGLTAYYMTRAVILTFLGRPRDEHRHEHAHESPAVMTLPLVVLAVPAVLAGLLGSAVTGHWFQRFVAGEAFEAVAPSGLVQGLAIGLAVAGIAVAWLVYGAGVVQRAEMIRMLRPLYVLFKQKFYFDHAAAGVSYLTLGVASFVGFFDRWVIDGLVNGAGWLARTLGAGTRRLSVGSAQAYALTFFAAVVVGMIVLQVVGG
ncbi:MAG: NADH-quinone oxidoreductase subunit L, partial [Clostridia bacterium]|nr:NADH-quinone oxidoreductase subunit L [Clostridia bacterium]